MAKKKRRSKKKEPKDKSGDAVKSGLKTDRRQKESIRSEKPQEMLKPNKSTPTLKTPSFLRESDANYEHVMNKWYSGLKTDPPELTMKESQVKKALLDMSSWYRRDVTQPVSHCVPTYVTRCLVGEPGTTYKYLGLRMFAHGWKRCQENRSTTDQALSTMYNLAEKLTERTREHLDRANHSTSNRKPFTICLINRMDAKTQLKPMENGRCTVSWHADSSLEHFSTIAVYHILTDGDQESGNDPGYSWEVALRVTPGAEGPKKHEIKVDESAPVVAVNLPSAHSYYMLHDFNHHHQHAVLVRKSPGALNKSRIRYSCTFRLLRESHSLQSILNRCRTVCGQFHKKGRVWRSEQLLLNEIESEWLRQFYIQGSGHRAVLWEEWKVGINELWKYWSLLENRTWQTVEFLRLAAEGQCIGSGGQGDNRKERQRRKKAIQSFRGIQKRSNDDFFLMMAEVLESRASMRTRWHDREQDPVFKTLSDDHRPLVLPLSFDQTTLDTEKGGEHGYSSMPGAPHQLVRLSGLLQESGKAARLNDSSLLPDYSKLLSMKAQQFSEKNNDLRTEKNDYLKSYDWTGWNSRDFALEMQQPWAKYLLEGRKTIETRAYDLPSALLGRKILILESKPGEDGMSMLGDKIRLNESPCEVVGWCKFSTVKSYSTASAFQADEHLHLVSPQSGYRWREDRPLYGWVVQSCGKVVTSREHYIAVRRLRSLFETLPSQQQNRPHKRKALTNKARKKKRRF